MGGADKHTRSKGFGTNGRAQDLKGKRNGKTGDRRARKSEFCSIDLCGCAVWICVCVLFTVVTNVTFLVVCGIGNDLAGMR